MAKIIINAVSYRDAVLAGADPRDADVFDSKFDDAMEILRARAAENGFEFEVDDHGTGTYSYRVTDERGWGDLESAHDFMREDRNMFWALI
jgi:hypothetical protein